MLPSKSEIVDLVERVAVACGMNPDAIKGVVSVESSFDPYAARFEPSFRWTDSIVQYARANGITQETEELLQKTSFGLMQIMGGTARSVLMYRGPLPQLFDPEFNLELGIKHFMKLKESFDGRCDDAISAWNAGSVRKDEYGKYMNQVYVDKVLNAIRFYQKYRTQEVTE